MVIGTLRWSLDIKEKERVHFGSASPVVGDLILSYTPSKHGDAELFGPLQATILFSGGTYTKLLHAVRMSNSGRQTFESGTWLFKNSLPVRDGPLKLREGEVERIGFTLEWPETVDRAIEETPWAKDDKYDCSADAPLPPSYKIDDWDYSQNVEAFVKYHVSAAVSMPDIDVKIESAHGDEGVPVRYHPRTMSSLFTTLHNTKPFQYQKTVEVSNKFLLPEEERPSGFREKAKNVFNSHAYPTYAFNCMIEGPSEIHVLEGFGFSLTLRPVSEKTTTLEAPEMKVLKMSVKLRAITNGRVNYMNYEVEHVGKELIKLMNASTTDDRPFSKANDYTKRYECPVVRGLSCSFSTYNILSCYRFEVEVEVELAQEVFTFEHTSDVKVLPPVAKSTSSHGG